MNKLIVSLAPHVHGGDSVKKNMYGVLIALIPAFLVSLYFFGLGALIVTATSVAACLFFEWAIGKFLMKKETTTITDGSAIITGVLLAFNLPSNLPIWIIILGALFAIGVGKMSFGGLGCNPFNPALAGRGIPVAFIPRADDDMAGCRPVDSLYGCHDGCYAAGYYERCHQWCSGHVPERPSGSFRPSDR